MKQSGKFTIVDLLFIVGVSFVVWLLGLASLGRVRTLMKWSACGMHMHAVNMGLQVYYADNNDAFPMLSAAGEDPQTGLAFTDPPASAPDVYQLSGAFPQDNLSLLVHKRLIGWDVFLCTCTETKLKNRENPADAFGFGPGTSPANAHRNFIDYGLHIPQRYTAPGKEHQAWLTQNSESSLAIYADRPPAPDKLASEWSPNHPADGANVLFFDGSVRVMNSSNGIATGPDGTDSRNILKYWRDNGAANNIYAKDMGPDAMTGATTQPGPVRLGSISPPGPTDSRFDSVIYWRANP
jgi:prepilin-type processing-associated H-X9-DG protein